MKTSIDPRHQKRVDRMKSLFSYSFGKSTLYKESQIEGILEKLPQIDGLIQECAPDWPIDQINRIDLAILRLSVHDLIKAKTPYKVVIDEAVELAKEYGSENSPKFVNGVLGTVLGKIT
jgi:transcription antitermination protein NusB